MGSKHMNPSSHLLLCISTDLAPFADQIRNQLRIESLSVAVNPNDGYYTVSFQGRGRTTIYKCTCSAKDPQDACTPIAAAKQ